MQRSAPQCPVLALILLLLLAAASAGCVAEDGRPPASATPEPGIGNISLPPDHLAAFDAAMVSLDAVIAREPENATAWCMKGNWLLDNGESGEALACLDEAVALDPEYAYAWLVRGACLWNLGRYGEAEACFDRAAALDPGLLLPLPRPGGSVSVAASTG
jgi:cytochrome c-type biogenesis protein CcmH/NrfG